MKPLVRSEFPALVPVSEAQWARLQAIYPDGVCDWSKPGVGQQPAIPWQTYQGADGSVIYGGTPLGAVAYPGDAAVERAASIMASERGWNDARMRAEVDAVRRFYTVSTG